MKPMKKSIITTLSVLSAISTQAAVIFTSSTNLPTATASIGTDLLQETATSNNFNPNADITNGTTGAFDDNDGTNGAQVIDPGTYDFNLDLVASPNGYDISQINSYSGWRDARAGQSYTILFSTVDAPTTFIQITPGGTGNNAVLVGANGESLVTNVFDDGGALLGTGVSVIRFEVGSSFSSGNVWREIDVIGEATPAVPEPSAFSLLSLTSLGLGLRRRRA